MIDKNLKPWLIEVNTNPCLEESSALLKQLIPRMIDDAFKLTLDVLFPALKGDALPDRDDSYEDQPPITEEKFSVKGYANDYNMWGDKIYKFRPPT